MRIAVACMLLVIVGFFALSMWAIQMAMILKYQRDPPGVDCDNFIANFDLDNDSITEFGMLQQMAYHELIQLTKLAEFRKERSWYFQMNERVSR